METTDLVQLISTAAGAFIGGIAFAWRVRSTLPALFKQLRPALLQLISEAVSGKVKEEVAKTEARVDQVERDISWTLEKHFENHAPKVAPGATQ